MLFLTLLAALFSSHTAAGGGFGGLSGLSAHPTANSASTTHAHTMAGGWGGVVGV